MRLLRRRRLPDRRDSDHRRASTSSIPAPTKTILELATEEGRLGTLLGLLDCRTDSEVGRRRSVHAHRTDRRHVQKMDPDTLDQISKSPEVLTQLLSYHLVNGRVTQQDLDAGEVTTAEEHRRAAGDRPVPDAQRSDGCRAGQRRTERSSSSTRCCFRSTSSSIKRREPARPEGRAGNSRSTSLRDAEPTVDIHEDVGRHEL
jgi:hypothetical protein